MPRFTKKQLFIAGIPALLLALYAIAGFVIAPRLIRSAVLKDVPEAIGATPAVGEIRINPFLLRASVQDFSLTGAGGDKLLGFKRLFIDFELSSLWHRAYSFGNIDIDQPFVGAVVAADGTLNLAQLKPKASTPAKTEPRESTASIPAIRIGSFKVSDGLLTYEDHSRPDEFATRLEPINFELRDFTTGVAGGQFTFSGASKQGERIEWHGHVSVQPIESDGEFQMNGLLVRTLWEYLEDRLNFVVDSGSIDLAATYKFSAGGGPQALPANLQLDVSNVALNNLAVRPKDSDADWIKVPSLAVTGTGVDLGKHHAHVDRVALTGLDLRAWLEPDGTVNLSKLAASPPRAGAPSQTSPPPAAPDAPWTYDVRVFDLRDARLAVEDRTTHPAVKLDIAPLNVELTGLSQDLAKPISVTLDARLNERGSLRVGGAVTPQPVAADVDIMAEGVDLALLQPYIAQRSSMTLKSGTIGVDAKAHYGAGKNAPAARFAGNIFIDHVHTVDDALDDDFINWERLEISGVDFTQGPDRLDIEQIVARKPYARVIIETDESVNVKRVMAAPGSPAARAPVHPAAERHAAPAPEVKAAAAGHAARKAARSAAPIMPISVKRILVKDGQANFSDLSVKPNFSTGIQGLQGSITGLSSKPSSRATIDLHGSVDRYAPVSITGTVNVLGPKLYTDVGLSFSNIALPIFNPYSGKFAGYNISKGKLSTELHYKVDGRLLDAQHHIVVDQLEFGDKTASKEAVSLPIKLAVSLLKDRNGVIDLNLPVTGSLDDPKFRLAPIIWKVFVNILEKAITAPFALLGSLFGSGPDLQFIDFKPGVSVLDAGATEKVTTVAKALIERPQLKIDVPIAVVPDLDRPALVDERFAALVDAAAGAPDGRRKPSPGAQPRSFADLEPAAQLGVLDRVYAKEFGAEPKFPEFPDAKSKPDLTASKLAFLSKAVRDHIEVSDADLQALGQRRARALQNGLLSDPQIAPERVFLVGNDKATAKDGTIRLELTLE